MIAGAVRLARSLAAIVALVGCTPAPPLPPKPSIAADADAERVQRWRRFLVDYLRVDTTSPPGNEALAAPVLSAALTEVGLSPRTTTVAPGRVNVMAVLAAAAPDPGAGPLILLHHIDVVPAEVDRWTVPPFAGLERDGKLYGRGAIDTKSLAALHLYALERLAKAPARLKRSVVFLAVSDEESLGLGAQHFVAHELRALGAEYLLDEGGFAIRRFLGEHDVAVIATAQKRTSKLRLTVRGAAGHGSRPLPTGGPSLLARALVRLLDDPPPMRLGPYNAPLFGALASIAPFPKSVVMAQIEAPGVLSALSGALSADKNLNPILRDTLALTVVAAGDKSNVIPSEGSAIFDLRLLPDTDVERLVAELNAKVQDLGGTIEILEGPLPPAEPSPTADPLFQAIREGILAHAPATTVSPWLLVGASDARFFRAQGVKTYGFDPIFLDKEALDTIHGHDEAVKISELEAGMRIYAEVLERFLLRP